MLWIGASWRVETSESMEPRSKQAAHLRAVLVEPVVDERHVDRAAHAPGALAERVRRPQQRDARRRVVRVQRRLPQERLHLCAHAMHSEFEAAIG